MPHVFFRHKINGKPIYVRRDDFDGVLLLYACAGIHKNTIFNIHLIYLCHTL